MEPALELPGFNKLVRCRHGTFLANENDTYVGRSLIKYGEFSQHEAELFAELLKPGDVVVEAGANIGALTVPLARLVGPHGRVLASEPQPVVFQMLCANLSLNGLTNVDGRNCALSSSRGEVRIPHYHYDKPANFGGLALADDPGGTPVPIATVDEIFRYDRLRLVKVDVEGMERDVLEGARETIQRHKPVLYVENDRLEKSEALIRFIMALGYRLWWHVLPLFNPGNFRHDAENIFANIFSYNMLCFPVETEVSFSAPEIIDPTFHPLRREDAPSRLP